MKTPPPPSVPPLSPRLAAALAVVFEELALRVASHVSGLHGAPRGDDAGSSGAGEFLTTAEAAQLVGLSPAALNQRRLRGTGPVAIKVGARFVRYERRSVLAWLRAQP